jgi:hypothetical protein
VRSNFIDMKLDHDSGAMTGTIIAGRLKGTSLDALELSALVGLLAEFDPESRNLLAAYLDRRHPGWREHMQGDSAAGLGGGSPGPSSTRSSARRSSGCSASSMRKAATYWQRILTAGIPDGVRTRRAMRQRGAARRDPAK